MLILSRHVDESIIVGDDVVITIIAIRGDKVRIGIHAPKSLPVHRREIYEAICTQHGVERLDSISPG